MTRETLPNRRETTGFQFDFAGHKYMAHVGRYRDGRIAEVFLTAEKVGTGVDTLVRAHSTTLSIALQHGASVESFRKAMPRDPRGEPMEPLGALLDLLMGEE